MKKTVKKILKRIFKLFEISLSLTDFYQRLDTLSIKSAIKQQKLSGLLNKLRIIQPDISYQENREKRYFNSYLELKRRALQSFQCMLMLEALKSFRAKKLTVVDIGDSAGTHMNYLNKLTDGKLQLDTISINLDPVAIEKIKSRGQKAILGRAEELDLGGKQIDLFTSFQMIEHLHDPTIFFRRLAKKTSCNRFVITVPYLKSSRVGLHYTKSKTKEDFFAEDEHVFELNPTDWTLLILHGGWRVVYSEVYYQYPKRLPIISSFLSTHWRRRDFEGFWGAILEKDTKVSDQYQDWKD